MTLFRPCIDLHDGQVKQIVGGTLSDSGETPRTHFISDRDSAWYAKRYRDDDLTGGHVIRLGPGNDQAAAAALAAWPGGLRLGGAIDGENAQRWLDAGAEAVIVTSWLFVDGRLSFERARELARQIGPERLVVDLSCREVDGVYRVATNRWQTVTETAVEADTLDALAEYCSGFLIHAASREGLQQGIDERLVSLLGEVTPLPCTYAGGGRAIEDLQRVDTLSQGRVDLVLGSALDLFGGQGVRYADCVDWNRTRAKV
ncbi:MAG: phosphoribosylformimino-5-aminoimidazole carboxamide ribotide isomerase [bacterium TMED88]|nr:phosphoribosylformimino-5-aminoimidazole carboxamide ribotide isomerase [Deltaproteobacteria bacterium]OUV28042.1 MAG: phosphoribosylformimino-5-aminoimidazole carboxamide ribotide isomerase [bacterium TMED88]